MLDLLQHKSCGMAVLVILFTNFKLIFSTAKLPAYSQDTITLTLPADRDIVENSWRWLSIYCITARQNFGEVQIPANPNLIPYLVSVHKLLNNRLDMGF